MKIIYFSIMFLVSACAFADVKSDQKELTEIGKRILATNQTGTTDWSCIGSSGRDFCKVGALHYDRHWEETKVTGEQFKLYIESLKKNEASENKCLDLVMDKTKYKSSKWEDYQAAIDCLETVDYEITKPDDVDYFYFKPTDIFSQHNLKMAIDKLTDKRNELNPKLKDEAESEVITDAEFKKRLKEQKKAAKKDKTPSIPSSATMVKSPKEYMGKQYRLYMLEEKMHGFDCKKKPKAFCEFNYLSLDNGGMGQQVGQGLYSLECYDSKSCNAIENAIDNRAAEIVIVEMVNVVQMRDAEGKTRTAPLLKIIRTTD